MSVPPVSILWLCICGTTVSASQPLTLHTHRDRVQPLLHTLCTGVTDDELPAAASGLLTGSALVRGAALSALPHVPTLAEGMSPADEQVIMMMYVACHDVSESLALSAHQLWQASHCTLPDSYIQPLVQHLSSPHDEVRAATATAVASAMQLHPSTVSSAVAAIIELYYDYAPFAYRAGVAVGLQATGALLGQDDLKLALDFLIARGLADSDDDIRAAMVAAGAGMVDAHGDTHAAIMLPQLEGYLQPERAAAAAGDERHYDLVREGVVVLLGTLAAHLQQGDDKVGWLAGMVGRCMERRMDRYCCLHLLHCICVLICCFCGLFGIPPNTISTVH